MKEENLIDAEMVGDEAFARGAWRQAIYFYGLAVSRYRNYAQLVRLCAKQKNCLQKMEVQTEAKAA